MIGEKWWDWREKRRQEEEEKEGNKFLTGKWSDRRLVVSSFSSAFHRCRSGRCTAPIWSHRGHCNWAWTRTPSSSGPSGQTEQKEPAERRGVGVKQYSRLVVSGQRGKQASNWCLDGAERPHLKVHRDGRPGPFLFIIGGQQLDLSADLRLLHSSHAFDPRDNRSEHRWVFK